MLQSTMTGRLVDDVLAVVLEEDVVVVVALMTMAVDLLDVVDDDLQ